MKIVFWREGGYLILEAIDGIRFSDGNVYFSNGYKDFVLPAEEIVEVYK